MQACAYDSLYIQYYHKIFIFAVLERRLTVVIVFCCCMFLDVKLFHATVIFLSVAVYRLVTSQWRVT